MNKTSTKAVRKMIAKCKHCRYCSNRNQSWMRRFIDRILGFDIFVRCHKPSNMVFNVGNYKHSHSFYCYSVCGNCKVHKK